MSATGVFSYAQAARGVGSSSATSSIPPSSASSDHGTKDHPVIAEATNGPPKAARNLTRTSTDQSSILDASTKSLQPDPVIEKTPTSVRAADVEGPSVSGTKQGKSSSSDQHPSSPPQSTASSDVRGDVEPRQRLEGGKSSSEDKTKDVDDDWEKISLPSMAAEKELKEAPVPTVNFWQKRKQEQDAKLKQETPRLLNAEVPAKSVATDGHLPKTSSAPGENLANKRSNSSKGQPNTSQPPRTSSQRDAVQQTHSSLPPVDTASWPTPENATTSEMVRRPSNVEKADRAEGNDTKSNSRKNQWQAMPFVPSVKFETQLPGSRRGTRPSDGRTRGGRIAQGERTADRTHPGSMGPPPTPKNSAEQDRGRKNNLQKPPRATSAPGDGTKLNESTQNSIPISAAAAESFEPSPLGPSGTIAQHVPTSSSSPMGQLSRSSSQHPPHHKEAPFAAPPFVPSGSARDPTGSPARRSPTGGRGSGPRTSQDFDRSSATREHKKDQSGSARDRDNWREARGQSTRGRANYRGRGGHAGYVTTAAYTTPLLQNGFDVPRAGSLNEGRSNRHSMTFNGPPSITGHRGFRNQQSPMEAMINGGYFSPSSMTAYPQILSPIQPNLGYPSFSPVGHGLPGVMPPNSAINTPELQMYAVHSMVATQVEYYFSLDNLCKDMYLRKHMDSQGFVPLRVISEFRRVKSLLGETSTSYDQLCALCQQARNVEVATGEDGELRLRSRDNWKDFVLPMEERLPIAQNDGPSTLPHKRQPTSMPYDFDMTHGSFRNAAAPTNGFHNPFEPSAASFITPDDQQREIRADLSQSARKSSITSSQHEIQSPRQDSSRLSLGNMTNGHRNSTSSSGDKESTFPDESVAALKVVVKDPEYQGEGNTTLGEQSHAQRASGLRGGAGSPEQLHRRRSVIFGHNISPAAQGDGGVMYFTPHDGPPPQFQKPGFIHEQYPALYERAQAQRAEGYVDDAVKALYNFWSEFLCVPNQFNVGLYEDFKTWALQDQENGHENGKAHLVRFYDAMLGSKTAVTERIARDIVNIARAENKNDRPLWRKLRAAWRNGATNMKTLKRLTDLLSAEEKAELDGQT